MNRRWQSRWVVWVALIWALAAGCSAALEPVVPTPRPTLTPSITVPPSPTFLAAPALATPTRLVPPTATFGPSPTPLFGLDISPTPFTPSPTPAVIISGTLRVEYFTADVQSASPGDVVTLFWSVRGVDVATIYRLLEDGTQGQSWSVARVGSLQVRLRESDSGEARFQIVAGDTTTSVNQTLSVTVGCALSWFFGEPGCPNGVAISSVVAEQPYENGLMVWVGAQRRIYVLFRDDRAPTWAAYADAFQDGQPESDPAFAPPEGRLQPVRGFGLLWRTETTVRDRLGWATAPEFSYETQLQGDPEPETGVMIFQNRDGQLIELTGGGSSWRVR